MDQMEAAGLPGPMTLGGTTLPLVGRARVYACGITPYDVTHVGHAAAFVWVDTLSRVLRDGGAEVIICRNVTDVDDVLLAAADRAGSPYDRFAAIQQFFEALGLTKPPRVEIDRREITLLAEPGSSHALSLEVSTQDKRPVFAHGTSNVPWLEVGRAKFAGKSATVPMMPLEKYWKKRDFGLTPEPAGAPAAAGGTGRFVIQRHRATRLHYDLRLEIEGVLVSWAVPKGLTQDPSARRMAVHVEDHPIEYFDFEGVIPAKQYGAGDVIVWDWGTWEPEAETPDPRQAIADGDLKFVLHGQKNRGRFTIVRTSRRPGSAPSTAFEDDSEQWLLIKKRDADAVAGWDAEDHPQSVKTGRTNDEVKANRDAIWISEQPAAVAGIDLAGAVAKAMPDRIEPMLATLATKPFSDPDWLYEIKWDGYRVQSVVRDGKVKLWTRSLKDGETYFPKVLSPPTWIDAKEAIVDGEMVALDEAGRPDFSLLQERISQRRAGSGSRLLRRESTCPYPVRSIR
jgi:DNA ligase D-like protein (predicted 3'-phosphoesterase)